METVSVPLSGKASDGMWVGLASFLKLNEGVAKRVLRTPSQRWAGNVRQGYSASQMDAIDAESEANKEHVRQERENKKQNHKKKDHDAWEDGDDSDDDDPNKPKPSLFEKTTPSIAADRTQLAEARRASPLLEAMGEKGVPFALDRSRSDRESIQSRLQNVTHSPPRPSPFSMHPISPPMKGLQPRGAG